MTKEEKLACLKARRNHILARGRYDKCPGVLNKVIRKIKLLEK